MFQLNKLIPAGKDRKRVGRGGSRGGTSGKGHKGQKARSGGYIRVGFEGGQMPLFRRLPKRGFNNANFQKIVFIVNLGQLNSMFQDGDEVTPHILIDRGIIKSKCAFDTKSTVLKVLANGNLQKRLTVRANSFSKTAVDAIVKAGGIAEVI